MRCFSPKNGYEVSKVDYTEKNVKLKKKLVYKTKSELNENGECPYFEQKETVLEKIEHLLKKIFS